MAGESTLIDTSRGGVVQAALELRSWNATGKTFLARANRAYNLALAELAELVPEALVTDVEHAVVYPATDSQDDDVKARVNATSDSLVLRFSDEAGNALGASTTTTWQPNTDGVWDGIMHLEIEDDDGVIHRRQSLEWWSSGSPAEFYVSIDRPWTDSSATLMPFRIVQPEFYLRGDVQQIVGPARLYDSSRLLVGQISSSDAHRFDLVDYRGQSAGRPEAFFRGNKVHLPPVKTAPQVSFGADNSWVGPVQEGTFRFFVTVAWGYRDPEWQDAALGVRDPIWESPPSPVSDTVVQGATTFHAAIILTMTDIDVVLGFYDTTALRHRRSGRRLRIYVARDAVYTGGNGLAAYNQVDSDGIAYLLADVRLSPSASTATYTWDGSVLPDTSRRLRVSTGYFGFRPYPMPDDRYEIDIPVLRQPDAMGHDAESPPVNSGFESMFLHLYLAWLCELDGADAASSDRYRTMFDAAVQTYRRVHGHSGGVITPSGLGGAMSPKPLRLGRYTEV